MDSQTFVAMLCVVASTLFSFAGGTDLPLCDFFEIAEGYLEASGGAEGNLKCTQWNTLADAKSECLSTRGCDGFSFGKSGAAYGGCLKKNREAGYNGNKNYAGFHKNIMGCCQGDEYELQGHGQRGAAELLVSEGKVAIQSSEKFGGVASRAVDGDTNTKYPGRSCTHTARERSPWWQVDLGGSYEVTRVLITNRSDCCHERLRNCQVRVGDSVDSKLNALCANCARIGKGETKEFKCALLRGRYVTVQIYATEYLTLCEVQVFALVDGDSRESRVA